MWYGQKELSSLNISLDRTLPASNSVEGLLLHSHLIRVLKSENRFQSAEICSCGCILFKFGNLENL
jgi:hypothetical protein